MEGHDESVRGAFLSALRAHRSAVLRSIDATRGAARMAEFVFDLFSHLALKPEATLDEQVVSSFLARHELDPSELRLPGGMEPGRLDEVLAADPRPPGAVELINALLARGYAHKLSALSSIERRNFTLRVVAMLPGVERLGPFVLSDFIDLVCEEEDALRFWQIYVDRVAAEVSKRTQTEEASRAPWLLSQLLSIHEKGPAPARGNAWITLRRHVNRVLQTRRHRWRFIRSLAEGCHDPRMLHYLCTAPAMVEDPEVTYVFLVRGNSRLVSAALFALQIHADLGDTVDRVLGHFRERPLPEVAARLVEIYAQLHLPTRPAPALRQLAEGLRTLVRDRIDDGSIEPLLQAVANDARALRQSMLLADLARGGDPAGSPRLRRLLERVVSTFFQSFTPSGVYHPLNDEVFQGGVRRALRALMGDDVPDVRARIEAFGLGLGEAVDRWLPPDADEVTRARLLGRFRGLFAHTLVGACRALYADDGNRGAGLAAYGTLIRVYLAEPNSADAAGWFGALEYVLPALYADLQPGVPAEPARVAEAAEIVAQVEEALWPGEDRALEAPLVFPHRVDAAAPAAERATPLLYRRPTRDRPLEAPAVVLRRSAGRAGSVLRAYLGLDLLAHFGRGLLHFLGFRRRGRVRLTDQELVVTAESTFLGQLFGRTGDSHRLEDLVAVHVRQRMRAFYLVLGASVLVTCGVLGGHLLFVGLRGAENALMLMGGGLLGLGLLFDGAMTRLAEENRRHVVLDLHCRTRPRQLTLLIDTEAGSELLDAFMAADAERRELELADRWTAADVRWEPVGEAQYDEGEAQEEGAGRLALESAGR